MTSDRDIWQTLLSLFYLGVEGSCLALAVVLACLSFRSFRETWRRALLLGIIASALAVPSVILGMLYVDVAHFAPKLQPEMLPVVRVLACIFAGVLVLAMVPLRGLYYHVSAVEWSRVRGGVGVILEGLNGPRATRMRGMLVGLAVGLATLKLTYIFFPLLDVHDSDQMKGWEKLFPGMENANGLLVIIALAGFVCSAAIVEEFIFRGMILGWLLRLTRNKALWAWVFIVAVAFLWALLHIPNTNRPVVKVSQIFLMGVALGGMARTWGIGSSITAHVTLNFGAVMMAFVDPDLDP